MAWTLAEVAASSEEGEVAASSEEAGEGAEADGTSTSSRGPGSFGPGTRQGPDAGSVSAATPTGVVGRSATAATLQSQVVQSMCPELAWKITGMLLQIDHAELVLMMEDPTSLKGKVRPDTSFIVVSLVHPNTLLQAG